MTTKTEIQEYMRASKKLGFDYTTVSEKTPFITVMRNGPSGEEKKMAMFSKTTRKDGRPHTAYVAYDGDVWHIGCGNHFLEGKFSVAEATAMATKVATSATEKKEILNSYGSEERNTYCHFWKTWNEKRNVCKHVSDLLADTTENDLNALEALLEGEIPVTIEPMEESSETECPVAAKLSRYEHSRHICIMGEKGSGKTHSVYDYLAKNKIPHIFVGGNQDIEASDLRGNLLPVEKDGNKEFNWVDGPLTEAFRRAANGEKVCLLIDELLRISRSGLSTLIPSLTLDNDNHYVLPTGRVVDIGEDGVGRMEVLRAPRDKFWCIATTNVGAGYDLTQMDDALEDRFEYVEHNNEFDKIKEVVLDVASKNGISPTSALKLLTFYKKMTALHAAEELNKLINLRHLVQILEDCKNDADLYDYITDRIPKWVERDVYGKLLPEQIKLVEKALDKSDIKKDK